jgi:hypothetical protein
LKHKVCVLIQHKKRNSRKWEKREVCIFRLFGRRHLIRVGATSEAICQRVTVPPHLPVVLMVMTLTHKRTARHDWRMPMDIICCSSDTLLILCHPTGPCHIHTPTHTHRVMPTPVPAGRATSTLSCGCGAVCSCWAASS